MVRYSGTAISLDRQPANQPMAVLGPLRYELNARSGLVIEY